MILQPSPEHHWNFRTILDENNFGVLQVVILSSFATMSKAINDRNLNLKGNLVAIETKNRQAPA